MSVPWALSGVRSVHPASRAAWARDGAVLVRAVGYLRRIRRELRQPQGRWQENWSSWTPPTC